MHSALEDIAVCTMRINTGDQEVAHLPESWQGSGCIIRGGGDPTILLLLLWLLQALESFTRAIFSSLSGVFVFLDLHDSLGRVMPSYEILDNSHAGGVQTSPAPVIFA